MQAGVPEARNEDESLVAWRLGSIEANMTSIHEKLDGFMGMIGQVNLIDHRLKELEKSKQRILGSVGALFLLVIGQLADKILNGGS